MRITITNSFIIMEDSKNKITIPLDLSLTIEDLFYIFHETIKDLNNDSIN